jgi:hypothetical protein
VLLVATVAADSAGTPGRPFGDLAVDVTQMSVAVAVLDEVGARYATVGRGHTDGAGTSLGASAASLVALHVCAPLAPGSDLAVDGAKVGGAGLRVDGGQARHAAVVGVGDSAAAPVLGAGAAGLGAGAPGGETGEDAVNGARVNVA